MGGDYDYDDDDRSSNQHQHYRIDVVSGIDLLARGDNNPAGINNDPGSGGGASPGGYMKLMDPGIGNPEEGVGVPGQYEYEYTEEEHADGSTVSVRRRRKLRTVNFTG